MRLVGVAFSCLEGVRNWFKLPALEGVCRDGRGRSSDVGEPTDCFTLPLGVRIRGADERPAAVDLGRTFSRCVYRFL